MSRSALLPNERRPIWTGRPQIPLSPPIHRVPPEPDRAQRSGDMRLGGDLLTARRDGCRTEPAPRGDQHQVPECGCKNGRHGLCTDADESDAAAPQIRGGLPVHCESGAAVAGETGSTVSLSSGFTSETERREHARRLGPASGRFSHDVPISLDTGWLWRPFARVRGLSISALIRPSGDGSAGSNPAGGTSVPTAKIAPHLLKQGEGRSCCVRTSLAVGGRWRASVPNTCRSSGALREQRPGLARSAAPGLTPRYEDGRRTARHRPSRPAAVLRRRAGSALTVAPAELNAATRGRRGAGFIGDEQGPLRPGWSRHPHNQTTL
jgi:hypothetical protein